MTTSSDVPLSDAELARIEELATAAHDYGGDEQELGELALELVAEVRAAREREATGLLEFDAGHAYRRERFAHGARQGGAVDAPRQAEHDPRIDAVRALHQPLDAINVDAPPGRQRTRVCAVCAGRSGPWAVWPCATIQAIEGDDR